MIVKDVQNHPVRGQAIHLDLLRVDMNQPIHAVVVLELTGGDEAPGVTEGGVLSQETRELNIEALPDDIPDSITHDVSALEMNSTLTLAAVTVPRGRHAARRPRRDRHRHDHPADAGAGGRGDRDRDRADRRGRRAASSAPRAKRPRREAEAAAEGDEAASASDDES